MIAFRKLFCPSCLLSVSLLISCSSQTPNSVGVTVTPSSSAPTGSPMSQTSEVNACSLFSAADAQSIMGAPMRIKPGSRAQYVCMYEEVTAKPGSIGPGTVALTVNKSSSKDVEGKSWARMKEVRHLQAGEKNVKPLSGIGDEAWWTGNIEKGKAGVASVIARKGDSHFAIDEMVLEYRGSPDAMKKIAKRIADRL